MTRAGRAFFHPIDGRAFFVCREFRCGADRLKGAAGRAGGGWRSDGGPMVVELTMRSEARWRLIAKRAYDVKPYLTSRRARHSTFVSAGRPYWRLRGSRGAF